MTEFEELMLAELRNMRRELVTIRQLNSDFVRYMRDAESEIPESYRRFVNAFHDVHHIKYCQEEIGQPVDPHVLREIERLYDRYRQILDRMNEEGGAFNKVRREMASDPLNRYDHTRVLEKPKEDSNEAGKRE